ncbi:MAG: peptide chain release factor 2 [Kiritimatiellae bacterium]|nr:peptide chain release factor 2 [Kiritimatiellia bacterium]MDD4118348.1 peptide chain release factor 2 [Kiritimatiellia bacterium]
MIDELSSRLATLKEDLAGMRGYFDVAGKQRIIEELTQQMSVPGFWDDAGAARGLIDRKNALEAVVEPFEKLAAGVEDAEVMAGLLEAEGHTGGEHPDVAELARQVAALEKQVEHFELQSLMVGPFDANNAYLTLHAGAGGTESCDWAAMLLRMYDRYCQKQGFTVSTMDYQPGEEAGVKSVTLMVSGPWAYGFLKAERGVHRLVRISPFDSAKRRHTSFASLDVVAEISDDIEVEIDEKDLRVDTFRSGGAGGQHVNKTDSAIRITHLPSGIVVACQAERSQHSNRDKAMKVLRAKLYELEQDKQRREMEKFYGDKGEIAWGHQIRSYVLQPYTMVKDHRTETETGQVDAVLDGDLDRFVEAWLKQNRGSDGAAGR